MYAYARARMCACVAIVYNYFSNSFYVLFHLFFHYYHFVYDFEAFERCVTLLVTLSLSLCTYQWIERKNTITEHISSWTQKKDFEEHWWRAKMFNTHRPELSLSHTFFCQMCKQFYGSLELWNTAKYIKFDAYEFVSVFLFSKHAICLLP